jgi:hypothetical protein
MTSHKRVLLASSSVVVDLAPCLDVVTAQEPLVSANNVTVITRSGSLTQEELPRSTFDVALSLGPLAHHTVAFLGLLSAATVPGGSVVVAIVDETSPRGGAIQDVDKLKKYMLMAGLVEPEERGAERNGSDGKSKHNAVVIVAARRPGWDVGAKAVVRQKIQLKHVDDDDDDDLVTEEELLRPEDLLRPQVANGSSDETCGKAKACENCTCGRAEGQGPQKLTKEMLENPTSGCGSCGLGDAFRCAGCPYRGLPAFEMGKKIELPPDFLAVDLE